MQPKDFYYLGRIIKTSGNKGSVIVNLEVDDPTLYSNLESVYIDVYGEHIPFFLDQVEIKKGNSAVFKFQGIQTPEEADEFLGLQLFLPLSCLPPLTGNQFYYHEISGFTVTDSVKGELGKVDTVIDLPKNPLLRILADNREILIPVSGDIIKHVDRTTRSIQIEAPEGLIDIYI